MNYSTQDIQQWFANNPNADANTVGKTMYQFGVTPQQVADATGFGIGYVTDQYNKANGFTQSGPQISGLGSALGSLSQGAQGAIDRIDQTQNEIGGMYQQGLGYLNPYMQSGSQANDLQAALSGALGPEAQAAAFANYQSSPGVQFAQQEAERALLRNASATGGLGGGNVLRDLTQLAAGTFMQDYNNHFQQIGSVADRGYGAATTGAGLLGQQAQVHSGLGQFAANIPMRQAELAAQMQFQAGRDIAQGVQNTSSSLSNLISNQGQSLAGNTGNYSTNLTNLYQNAMNGDAQAKEHLASLLGNLSVNQANMYSSQPITPVYQPNYTQSLGTIAGSAGGLLSGLSEAGLIKNQG